MNFRELVEGDPFSTAADRAVAASFTSVDAAEAAASRLAWSRYTPTERAEMLEYWEAVRENRIWDAEMERAWDRHLVWSREDGWRRETDEEWSSRTAAMTWRMERGRWAFIGHQSGGKRAA